MTQYTIQNVQDRIRKISTCVGDTCSITLFPDGSGHLSSFPRSKDLNMWISIAFSQFHNMDHFFDFTNTKIEGDFAEAFKDEEKSESNRQAYNAQQKV